MRVIKFLIALHTTIAHADDSRGLSCSNASFVLYRFLACFIFQWTHDNAWAIYQVILKKTCETDLHWSNVLLQSPCESYPCQNGGTCLPRYETSDYNCKCRQNYTGVNCQNRKFFLELFFAEPSTKKQDANRSSCFNQASVGVDLRDYFENCLDRDEWKV